MLPNGFSSKHLPMATCNFWAYCCQNLAGLFAYKSKIKDIKKRVVKSIFLTIKSEWSNVLEKIIFLTILKSKILYDKINCDV